MPERVHLKKTVKHFDNFKYSLVIYFHNDLSIKDIYNRVIKKEKALKGDAPETHDRSEAITVIDDEGVAYLIINEDCNLSVIQHEVIHITTAIFDFIGSDHTSATDELYAYTAQHIFEFIAKTMIDKWNVPADKLLNL